MCWLEYHLSSYLKDKYEIYKTHNLDNFNLFPFLQLKKREKHPWRSDIVKPATLRKIILSMGAFHIF